MGARLVFIDLSGTERTVSLGGEPVYIGRGTECAVRTDDAMVSRKHSVVRRQGEGWHIEDLGSSNGTLVNGAPVKQQLLAPGDVIRCGSLSARYENQAGSPLGDLAEQNQTLAARVRELVQANQRLQEDNRELRDALDDVARRAKRALEP